MDIIPKDDAVATVQDVKDAIDHRIEQQRSSFDPGRFLTFTQGILGVIGTFIVFAGMGFGYITGMQAQVESIKERVTKTEYQAAIGITDREDLHRRVDKTDNAVSDIRASLASINTKLDSILESRSAEARARVIR